LKKGYFIVVIAGLDEGTTGLHVPAMYEHRGKRDNSARAGVVRGRTGWVDSTLAAVIRRKNEQSEVKKNGEAEVTTLSEEIGNGWCHRVLGNVVKLCLKN
jgi:hypothetical protein